MSSPKILSSLWSDLITLHKHVDGLIDKVRADVEPTQPISREIPFWTSIEIRFDHLPITYATVPAVNSDALSGNNVKRWGYENHSSRVYVRELSFQTSLVHTQAVSGTPQTYDARVANCITPFPFNFRWNYQTSITQRQYCETGRVLASAGGRFQAGNHLAFREPQIIEPMETFVFECELLGGFGMNIAAITDQGTSAVVAMLLSGYREGI